jgi:subtilisin family serine protease
MRCSIESRRGPAAGFYRGRLSVRRLRATVVVVLVGLLASAGAAPAVQAEVKSSSYIVMLGPGARTPVQTRSAVARRAGQVGAAPEHIYTHALEGFSARLTGSEAQALAADPGVAAVVPDYQVQSRSLCAEPIAAPCEPTGVLRIGRPGGQSHPDLSAMNVAVIDSGVNTTHPDLNVVGGTSCTSSPGFDDADGHGTHVAGALAATGTTGLTGVAPGARIWSVRVLDSQGMGSLSDIICGIDWVTGTRTDADPNNDIAVANMSLGSAGSDDGACGTKNHDPFHQAVCSATDSGVLIVAATANLARPMSMDVPDAYDEVLSVTAMADYDGKPGALGGVRCQSGLGRDDSFATFSDYAEKADREHTIAAPGVCILSSWSGGGYAMLSGTSMASPHVAGTAVLCIASGDCPPSDPAGTIAKLRADARIYARAHPARGFRGDPAHQVAGKYFGFLVKDTVY